VVAFRTNYFADTNAGPLLATEETAQQGWFDLRDWFKVTLSGYYRYHFELEPSQLGLPTDEGNGGSVYAEFTLGQEPRRLTFEELNQELPPLGDPQRAQTIKALIKESITEKGLFSTNRRKRVGASSLAPSQLPALDYTPFDGDNMSGMESEVTKLSIPNEGFLSSLELYTDEEARAKLEALLRDEKVVAMQLLLASEAMVRGSQIAALFVLENMTNTDYVIAHDTDDTLRLALGHYEKDPPKWLVEMAIAALSDERYVTGLQKVGWSGDTFFTMAYLADEEGGLPGMLGCLHCTNAVPFLIEMAKRTDGRRGPVMALGNLGDSRAIPVLIEFVKQKGPATEQKKGWPLDDGFLRPVVALGNLHAKEAVPVLLGYVQYPDVIEALEEIGDSGIVSPLQRLIASQGRIEKAGAPNEPELEQKRLAAARIAVASLDTDRTSKLCELLTDSSFDQYQRRSVVWQLGNTPDPRAVPFLGKAIKTDPSGAVVNQAITVLAVFKYKTTVDALIECFDADFNRKSDWKRAYKPEMFRANLAKSLSHLTGQHIGADKQQWLTWWRAHREAMSGLQ
jgi:HEAT repeat protein